MTFVWSEDRRASPRAILSEPAALWFGGRRWTAQCLDISLCGLGAIVSGALEHGAYVRLLLNLKGERPLTIDGVVVRAKGEPSWKTRIGIAFSVLDTPTVDRIHDVVGRSECERFDQAPTRRNVPIQDVPTRELPSVEPRRSGVSRRPLPALDPVFVATSAEIARRNRNRS